MNRVWLLLLSAGLSAIICIRSGLIPGWGIWYSPNPVLRLQTTAMLNGSLALGMDPSAMPFDTAWSEQGVQQVWGVGVPSWRCLFELAAAAGGKPAFPDRLAFALALALVTYAGLRHFATPWNGCFLKHVWLRPSSLAIPILLVAFPPFLTVCGSWFNVYEEVEAYTYLAAIALLVGALSFARKPGISRLGILAFFSGLAPLVRPSLLAYGVASFTLLLVTLKRHSWGPWKWALGFAAFALGGTLVFTINSIRFGSGFEFGHSLNLNNVDTLRYASRFDHPFRTEQVGSAARELFSSLFLVPNSALRMAGHDKSFFPGQSPTFRWREHYFSTYDLTYANLLVGAWIVTIWAITTGKNVRGGTKGLEQLRLMGIWSFVGFVPTFYFYLHFYSITSRYLIDFAPAFAVAGCVLLEGANHFFSSSRLRRGIVWGMCSVGVLWGGYEVSASRYYGRVGGPRSLAWPEMHAKLQPEQHAWSIPESYDVGMDPTQYGIPRNGVGWDWRTGETKASVAFFIKEPRWVELEMSSARDTLSDDEWRTVRAKIGLEFLSLKGISETANGKRLIFHGPRERRCQFGIQLLFVGLVAPDELSEQNSKFRLLRVQWRNHE